MNKCSYYRRNLPPICSAPILGLIFCFAFGCRLLTAAPPSDLVVTGIPDIPQSVTDAIAPYWTETSNEFMGWDPLTGAMLVRSLEGDVGQLNLISGPQGKRKIITNFPEGILSGSFLPRQGNMVIFGADHNGDEDNQLYSLDVATGNTHLLTDGESRNGGTIYSRSGVQLAYLSTLRDQIHSDIYVMNPNVAYSSRMVMENDSGIWSLQDWTQDDHHVLASHIVSSQTGYLWLIDTASGDSKLLTSTLEFQRPYSQARFISQDDGIYAIASDSSDFGTIVYIPLTDRAPLFKTPVTTESVVDIQRCPAGALIAYLTVKDHNNQIHFFDASSGEELPGPVLAPGFVRRMRWNRQGNQLGFSFGSTSMPDEAFTYDVSAHTLEQWTASPSGPSLDAEIKPELIQIPSFDGLQISGYLYRPDPHKFPGKRPVLVCIHGGPEDEFVPKFLGARNYYPDHDGIALFYPNVRGSSGFGERFASLDDGLKREDSVKDIGAFLDWIATDSGLDKDRVAVQGTSYGGYMTLASLYHYSNRLRCGSDLMGITDFVTFLHNTKEYRRANRRHEYGDDRYPDMNKFLESVSPLNHVAEIGDPLMITAGKNDPRVPESESDQMVKAIQAQHGIIWYMLGENEGHGFRRTSDMQYQFAAEAFFFEKYLLPKVRLTPLSIAPEAPPASPVASPGQD